MTDEELLIINCVIADPSISAHQTLGQWADNFNWDGFYNSAQGGEPTRYTNGLLTPEQMKSVISTVKNDPVLAHATIADVTPRPSDAYGNHGNNVTITSGHTLVVAYEGTSSSDEWADNGKGGYSSVTETPDQKAALDYFNQQMGQYGSGYSNIVTTGHSKGGNMASYVAIVSGGVVDRTVNDDGQGFNEAFMLKYQQQILAQKSKIITYADAADYVNILFNSVAGQTLYTQQSGLPADQFWMNHSAGDLLEPISPTDPNLRLRPLTAQDPKMAAADQLMDYLEKFLSPGDFSMVCDLAMGMITGNVQTSDMIDESKVPAGNFLGILDFLMDQPWQIFKEPYRTLFQRVFQLFASFYMQGGMSDEALASVEALVEQLLFHNSPGEKESRSQKIVDTLISLLGGPALKYLLSGVPKVPYSSVVRKFTSDVEQELLTLVNEVTPHNPWTWFTDAVSDLDLSPQKLDFSSDEAQRKQFYKDTIDKNDMTSKQIKAIFTNVNQTDRSYAQTMATYTTSARSILSDLTALQIG